MPKLTVFTPTYNRAYVLSKLYQSLITQTNKSFIWLVVDDGSTDNTQEVIGGFINENKIEIKYFYQPNGGKMRAHNQGVKMCDTELFVCVDSDDHLVSDAVESMMEHWSSVVQEKLAGIVAYCGRDTNTLMAGSTPFPITNDSTLKGLYDNRFKGDTTLVYRSEILKKYLFEEIEGEKFLTENYIYYQIDRKYKLSLLPKILKICEYLDDGYTLNSRNLYVENPKGSMLVFKLYYEVEKKLRKKLYYLCQYLSFAIQTKEKKIIRKSPNPTISLVLYPFAYILYLKHKRQKRML